MKTPYSIIFLALALASPGQDVNKLYQEGRAAYYNGDILTAEKLLNQVAAIQPNHPQTSAILADINLKKAQMPDTTLSDKLKAVTIDIILADVSLTEAIEALRKKVAAGTKNEFTPNFIVKPGTAPEARVTLEMKAVPASEVLRYIATLTDVTVTFDKHIITIASEPVAKEKTPSTPLTKALDVVLLDARFYEASLQEATEFLRVKIAEATNKKITPNFIITSKTEVEPSITMDLNAVPATEIVRQIAAAKNMYVTFEEHAIVFSPKASQTPQASPKE